MYIFPDEPKLGSTEFAMCEYNAKLGDFLFFQDQKISWLFFLFGKKSSLCRLTITGRLS